MLPPGMWKLSDHHTWSQHVILSWKSKRSCHTTNKRINTKRTKNEHKFTSNKLSQRRRVKCFSCHLFFISPQTDVHNKPHTFTFSHTHAHSHHRTVEKDRWRRCIKAGKPAWSNSTSCPENTCTIQASIIPDANWPKRNHYMRTPHELPPPLEVFFGLFCGVTCF